jgi:hypothetical protein
MRFLSHFRVASVVVGGHRHGSRQDGSGMKGVDRE